MNLTSFGWLTGANPAATDSAVASNGEVASLRFVETNQPRNVGFVQQLRNVVIVSTKLSELASSLSNVLDSNEDRSSARQQALEIILLEKHGKCGFANTLIGELRANAISRDLTSDGRTMLHCGELECSEGERLFELSRDQCSSAPECVKIVLDL